MNIVIGVKKVDYKNKAGREVHGAEIVYKYERTGYEGYDSAKVFIGDGVIKKMGDVLPKYGDQIDFTCGMRDGKAYVNGWTYCK